MSDTHKIEIVDNNELTLKEIRETFYHCRDFEITNLWQRSIFLFGFILACFTGYGAILISLLTTGDQKVAYPYLANFIECLISLIGIVFSAIWIMMAKGSKAWYEIYEKAIGEIEGKNKKGKKANKKGNDSDEEDDTIDMLYQYKMGNYCTQHQDYLDDCLFSTKGGRYSPSKLNVFIGQVLLVIWIICFSAHFAVLSYKFLCWLQTTIDFLAFLYELRYLIYIWIGGIICYIVIVLIFADRGYLTSSVIKEKK